MSFGTHELNTTSYGYFIPWNGPARTRFPYRSQSACVARKSRPWFAKRNRSLLYRTWAEINSFGETLRNNCFIMKVIVVKQQPLEVTTRLVGNGPVHNK